DGDPGSRALRVRVGRGGHGEGRERGDGEEEAQSGHGGLLAGGGPTGPRLYGTTGGESKEESYRGRGSNTVDAGDQARRNTGVRSAVARRLRTIRARRTIR